MAQAWAKAFYSGGRWLACREAFCQERVAIDGGLCQDCKDSLGEIAHHWPVPLTAENIQDETISLSHDNLRWVCKRCHDCYPGHGVAKPITPVVMFDANGDVIPPLFRNAEEHTS